MSITEPAKKGFYRLTFKDERTPIFAKWDKAPKNSNFDNGFYTFEKSDPHKDAEPQWTPGLINELAKIEAVKDFKFEFKDFELSLKAEPTQEDRINEAYDRFQRFNDRFDNSNNQNPVLPGKYRVYEAGQSVKVGSLSDCKVLQRLEQNPDLYAIQYTRVEHNYGRPIRHENQIDIWHWIDIRPGFVGNAAKSAICDDPNMARTHRIHSGLRMASRELETLTRDRCLGRLRDDAAYQRGYVWQDKDKQNFLDAVFELRPIGEIALLAPSYSDREYFFMLVDGKQRVNTLCEFFSNNLKWRGRYFDELHYRDQVKFTDRSINVFEMDRKEFTEADVLEVFIGLNKAGVPQTEEHLNHVTEEYFKAAAPEKGQPYWIFLDDERFPANLDRKWIICRTPEEFKSVIEQRGAYPNFISFDHDLGINSDGQEMTGYRAALSLLDYAMDNPELNLPEDFNYNVHSQNPIGVKRIESAMQDFTRYMKTR